MTYGPFAAGLDPAERRARCRALRSLALLIIGQKHPLIEALPHAEHDDVSLRRAAEYVDCLTPIRRRRLLCAYAAVAR
jgi:hypothetical protein